MAYDWRRNNIRELRNVIERMIIGTDGEALTGAAVLRKSDVRRTTHDARQTTNHARSRNRSRRRSARSSSRLSSEMSGT